MPITVQPKVEQQAERLATPQYEAVSLPPPGTTGTARPTVTARAQAGNAANYDVLSAKFHVSKDTEAFLPG